jgi:hypothetical protein
MTNNVEILVKVFRSSVSNVSFQPKELKQPTEAGFDIDPKQTETSLLI